MKELKRRGHFICKAVAFSVAATIIFANSSMAVHAQPKTMEDGTIFDADHYQKYDDVVAVYGTSEAALYKHYTQYGIAENREAVAAPDKSVFDAQYYARQNPDVVAVYGTGSNSLYQHYLAYGEKEGRKPTASSTKANTQSTAQASPATQEKAAPAKEESAPVKEEAPKTISDEDAQGLFLAYINNVDNRLLSSLPAGAFEFFDADKNSSIDQGESAELIMWLIDKYNDSNKGEITQSEQITLGRALYNGTLEFPASLYYVQR